MPVPQSKPPSYQKGGDVPAEPLKKLGGITWWLIMGFLILTDIVGGVLSLALEALGGVVTATVAGAVIGIPVLVVGWGFGLFLTGNAFIIILLYFMLNKVPLLQSRKLAAWGVGVIIEAIPILSVLPMTAISFLIVTIMENVKRGAGGGILGKTGGAVAKQVIKRTPVGYTALKVAEKVAERVL